MTEKSQVALINEQINRELTKETAGALLATTFKGLTEQNMKKAIMEGMIRGLTFKDFLEKNVYAIPFSGGYSLIHSIDYSRKVGMRSGIVGKDAPTYEFDEKKKPISCTVTVHRKIGEYVGAYTATVYFDEYYKAGKNGYPSLWDSKPKTMIAKVAEMHALRMACPEELSQSYIEEELEAENRVPRIKGVDVEVEKNDLAMGNFLKDGKENKKGKEKDEAEQDSSQEVADSEKYIEQGQ